jgi:O-antigen/teichoic acid export membrane protein
LNWDVVLQRIKEEFKQSRTLLQFGFFSATGQALGMVGPLVVAKFFSPELFGRYSLAKMVVFFFTSFLISSAQAPFIVFANQEKAKSGKINRTFSVQCVFFILSLCIFAAIALLLGKYIMLFAKIDRVDLFFVLLAFVGISLKVFLCNLFMAMGERIKNSLAELVFGVLSLTLVLILCFINSVNLRTVFLVYLLSAVALIIIFVKAINFELLFPLSFNKEQFKGMFDFTKWLMVGAAAAYFVDWGDNLVLRYLVSMEDIGNYNFGYQIFKGVATLILIVHGYFLPFVSEHIGDSEKMRNYLYSKRPRIFFLGFVLIGALFVFCPYILRLIYGDVYQDAVTILRILLIGAVLVLYIVFYETVLYVVKKYKFIQIVNLTHVSLNLLLDVLLVPVMGMMGAAIATVIAYFCRVVIIETYFRLSLKRQLGIL